MERRGWSCRVPTPRANSANPPWHEWCARLLDSLTGIRDPILAAHSAAGLLLPSLAAAVDASTLIFVDARVPPSRGPAPPVDAEFLTFIKALPTTKGRLPPWSRWWGEERLRKVIKDAALRVQFEADLPQLTQKWFDDIVEVPEWSERRCGYLQLSKTYEAEAAGARGRSWPVIEIDGTHLHPAIEPEQTADALLEVIAAVDRSRI